MKKVGIKLGWIEILFTLTILAVLASLLFPILSHRPYHHGIRDCLSHNRELLMASSMFIQDHNKRMPGLNDAKDKYIGWTREILVYIKGGKDTTGYSEVFYCYESKTIDKIEYPICYGYNTLLLQSNGMGIKEKDILYPNKVGVFCDSEVRQLEGGLVGSPVSIDSKLLHLEVKPAGRHFDSVVVGYADGHAASVPGKYNEYDKENGVNMAFYRAVELGYIKKGVTKGR